MPDPNSQDIRTLSRQVHNLNQSAKELVRVLEAINTNLVEIVKIKKERYAKEG